MASTSRSVPDDADPGARARARADRPDRDERRDALLDAAGALLDEGGIAAVTMDAVAVAAGVSRPLVYKHFANRDRLIADLWRRESAIIDRRVFAAVRDLPDFESVVRGAVEAILELLRERGRNASLLRGETFDQDVRDEQVERRRQVRAWYVNRIVDELGIDKADAEVAVTVFFAGLDSMLADWRSIVADDDRHRLVDVYVQLVMGGLRALQAAGE